MRNWGWEGFSNLPKFTQRMGGDSSLKAHEFDTLVTTASLNQASRSLTHRLTDPHAPHAHSRPLIHPELPCAHLFVYLNADQASTPSRNFCHYLSFHGPSLSLPPLIRFIVGTTDLSIQFHTCLYWFARYLCSRISWFGGLSLELNLNPSLAPSLVM